MNAPITAVSEADINAAAIADLKRAITQDFADTLTGYHKINGHFIKTTTDINEEGEVTVEMTRRRFGGDDCATQITLTVSDPVTIPPADLPSDISPRTTALLELWAADNTDPVTKGGGAA